jgi:hypothetical protein
MREIEVEDLSGTKDHNEAVGEKQSNFLSA